MGPELPGDSEAQPTARQYRSAFRVLLTWAFATFLAALGGWEGLRGWPFMLVSAAFAVGALGCWLAARRAAEER
jgi:hypothetical protein